MSVKFGKYRVFEESMSYIGADDISKTFLETDRYCYVTFSEGEGNYFVAFDDDKASREQVMELICDLYHPWDDHSVQRYEKQFFEQRMYKIPYEEVTKMLGKLIISFTTNGRDYVPLGKLQKVFEKYRDDFSIVPLKRDWEFLVVFGKTDKVLKNTNFSAFDTDTFISAMRDRSEEYWGYHTYFELVTTVINDLKKNGYDDTYRGISDTGTNVHIPTREVSDYRRKFEERLEKYRRQNSHNTPLTEGVRLFNR